jgi:hypothetical protein
LSLLSSGWLMLSNLTRGKCRAEFVRSDIHLNGRFAPTAADQRSSMLDTCFSPKRDYVTAACACPKSAKAFRRKPANLSKLCSHSLRRVDRVQIIGDDN